VRRMSGAEPAQLRPCHVAFVGKSQREHAEAIIDQLKDSSIFTVGDFNSFAEKGGIADLRIEGTKVRVDLNMNAANHANLKVSGKLQQVAKLVN
jgi:hypothetical protein